MITVDPYYDINMYNQFLNALENNNKKYKQYILAKAPFHFYLDIPEPYIINYDILPDNLEKFLVNVTEPATPNDAYLLQRRTESGSNSFVKYAMNKALKEAQEADYACFFHVRNREQAQQLSRELGKIYYFGYYYNKYKICLTTNKFISNYNVDILVEKTNNIIQMELDLNFKVFKLNDRLRKYTETPYILEGKYYPTKIQNFNHLV